MILKKKKKKKKKKKTKKKRTPEAGLPTNFMWSILRKGELFLIQFYDPFKIISAHIRRANLLVYENGRKNPEKKHL